MGIKDLYPVIREDAPEQLVTYHLSEFSGYRFAIDISVFLYKYIRTAGPIKWMNIFLLFLCTLKKHGIKAVCIFDGPNPPIEKKNEQLRRREVLAKQKQKLTDCISIRNKLQDKYLPYDKKPDEFLVKRCKFLLQARGRIDGTNYYDASDIIDALNIKIEKLEKQTLPITKQHTQDAINLAKIMGLAAFQADGEAETLCAYLAIRGEVDAVMTEDTDVLAYGTPFMIAFKSFKLNEEKVVGIHLPSLLVNMGLDENEFRDLCILLSCDYNSRVKGFPPDGRNRKKPVGIGAKGALAMIKEYRNLETVCKFVIDPTPLKYKRCRELFTIPNYVPKTMVPINNQPDYKSLQVLINKYKLSISVDYIKKCYRPPKIEFFSETTDEEVSIFDNVESLDTLEESEEFINGDVGVMLRTSKKVKLSNGTTNTKTKEYYVLFESKCENSKGKKKKIKGHLKFTSKKIYKQIVSSKDDVLNDPFDNWLDKNGYSGWFSMNTIKFIRNVKSYNAIGPILVE